MAKGQTLVIRGATSALGRAALNIAVDAGAHVIATTRKKQRFEALRELGAHRTEIETPNLSEVIPERKQIDAVLDLVGNTTFMDSLRMLRRGGCMCLAGWLGGLDPVNTFNPLLQMPSGVYFTFFGSFVLGTPEFPVSDIPLQAIVDKAAAGIYKAKPARVFQFDKIRGRMRRWNQTRPVAKWWFASEASRRSRIRICGTLGIATVFGEPPGRCGNLTNCIHSSGRKSQSLVRRARSGSQLNTGSGYRYQSLASVVGRNGLGETDRYANAQSD